VARALETPGIRHTIDGLIAISFAGGAARALRDGSEEA